MDKSDKTRGKKKSSSNTKTIEKKNLKEVSKNTKTKSKNNENNKPSKNVVSVLKNNYKKL